MKGFIVFEGCEGVGKSTQLRFLKEYLEKVGRPAVFTREPGGTPLAEEIRQLILTKPMSAETEAALFAAARCDHIDNLILPSLRDGKIVVCDRYIDSSLAYQAYARGLGYDFVAKANDYALTHCMPDLTIFMDVDPERAFNRKGGVDKKDRLELAGLEFHKKVYLGYKELIKKSPDRFVIFAADGTKYETNALIIKYLSERGYF